jgi:murein DD-endopeptidase MepM/ murein hydrolase activator NlpD
VIIAGSGGSLLRLSIPRVALKASAAFGCLAIMTLAFLATDYASLRSARADTTQLETRVAAQEQTIEQLRSGIQAIREDLRSWPALQAKILTPFGRVAAAEAMPAPGTDHEEVAGTVRHATGTLKQLANVMTRLAQLPTQWPVRAAINSEFGKRRSPITGEPDFHAGIDLASGAGAPVHAPAPGAVTFAGARGGHGLAVVLDHGSSVRTLYGHLSRVSVRTGQRVERGQLLGQSGNTGASTGAHLHYEVHVAGRPVNPRGFLWD